MKTNHLRNYSAGIFWKKYISLLLVVFVFVLGMLCGGTAYAAKITADDVSRTVAIQLRLSSNETKTAPIKMRVLLENIDLHAYEKYTVELRKNAKYGNVVFAKAAPGSQVSISADAAPIPGILSKPARDYNYSVGIKYYNHKKIGTLKELTSLGKEDGFVRNYTIPNDVEEVTAVVDLTYHVGMEVGKEMKSSIGTYRQEPRLLRDYYIFTSDAACKKAYDLMTASSVTGAISNVFGGDKKQNAKSDSKQSDDKSGDEQAGNKSGGENSGGLGTVAKVGIGVVAVGAIGFGAYRLFDKGHGIGGKGAGRAGSSATAPRKPERFEYTDPVAGVQATGRTGVPMGNAAGTVAYCKQCGVPLRSGSRFCANCGARNAPEFCKSCGAKLEPDCMFCGNCGAKV